MKQDIDLPTPVETAAARKWATDLARARAALASEQAERDQLAAALNAEPARSLIAARTALQALVDKARQDLQTAAEARAAADQAAQDFDAKTVRPAVDAVVEATRAVGDELARLMAQATTSTAVTATVDGLALRERFRTATAHEPPLWAMSTVPFRAHADDANVDPQVVLPVAGDGDFAALLAVLARLDDRVDAVAELVAAESVHHLVNGNPARAGGALEIAASGPVNRAPITAPPRQTVPNHPETGHQGSRTRTRSSDALCPPHQPKAFPSATSSRSPA